MTCFYTIIPVEELLPDDYMRMFFEAFILL